MGLEIIIVILILIQTRGASLGAGFGGAGGMEGETIRRGTDKFIFQLTIVAVSLFAVSLVIGFLLEISVQPANKA